MLCGYARYLQERGQATEEAAKAAARRLKWVAAQAAAEPDGQPAADAGGPSEVDSINSPTEAASSSDGEEVPKGAGPAAPEVAERAAEAPEVDGGADGAEGVVAEEIPEGEVEKVEEKEAEGYVVSVTGRMRHRRLHFVGNCYRIPGVHYADYVVYGGTVPPAAAYTTVCRNCWKEQAAEVAAAGNVGAEESDQASSGSSSSSSSSE